MTMDRKTMAESENRKTIPLFLNAKSPTTQKLNIQNKCKFINLKGAFFRQYEQLTKVLFKRLKAFWSYCTKC